MKCSKTDEAQLCSILKFLLENEIRALSQVINNRLASGKVFLPTHLHHCAMGLSVQSLISGIVTITGLQTLQVDANPA